MRKTVQIDWSKSEGGKFIKDPGEYIVKLTGYELDESDSGNPYIRWCVKVTEGKDRGATIKFVTSLTYKSLWKLEELLNSVKYPVKRDSVQNLDLEDVVNKGAPFAIEVVEGDREREDGKGYYLQVEDFMALDDYKNEPEVKQDTNEDMSKLEDLIEEYDLDIDLEDYDTYEEAKEAIEKARSKKKVEKVTYTEEMIEAFKSAELNKLAEQIGLEFDEDDSPRSKRRSLIKALRSAGMLEE